MRRQDSAVLVRGDGVAAYCCVHLLQQAGIPVVLDRPARPRLPAIMLSESALALIVDTFGPVSYTHLTLPTILLV